jgi:hypothetical protein
MIIHVQDLPIHLAKPDLLGFGTSFACLGVGVREVVSRNIGCAAGYSDDSAFLGTTDLGQGQICEEEAAEMVDGKEQLEAVDGDGACWLGSL